MPEARKRLCAICRRWFRPDARTGTANMPAGSRNATEDPSQLASAEPGLRHRMMDRSTRLRRPRLPREPLRLPASLNQLPWEFAKDQFGFQGADFIRVMGALIVRTTKDQFREYLTDPTRLSGTLPPPPEK